MRFQEALPGNDFCDEPLVAPYSAPGKDQQSKNAGKPKKPKQNKNHKKKPDKQLSCDDAADDACLEAAFQEARQQPENILDVAKMALVADNALQRFGGVKAKNGENYKISILNKATSCTVCGAKLVPPTVAAVTPKNDYISCLSSRCVHRKHLTRRRHVQWPLVPHWVRRGDSGDDAQNCRILGARTSKLWERDRACFSELCLPVVFCACFSPAFVPLGCVAGSVVFGFL